MWTYTLHICSEAEICRFIVSLSVDSPPVWSRRRSGSKVIGLKDWEELFQPLIHSRGDSVIISIALLWHALQSNSGKCRDSIIKAHDVGWRREALKVQADLRPPSFRQVETRGSDSLQEVVLPLMSGAKSLLWSNKPKTSSYNIRWGGILMFSLQIPCWKRFSDSTKTSERRGLDLVPAVTPAGCENIQTQCSTSPASALDTHHDVC